MRAAIHLHLFYPDVARELIDRVASLGRADIDVLATSSGPLDPLIDQALDRIPGRVVRTETPNRGWDIGPLLHLLPLIRAAYTNDLNTKIGGARPDERTRLEAVL